MIENINSHSTKADSFCGMLWSAIDQETTLGRRTHKIAAPNSSRLAAHLVCVAVACQEIHCGRPNATFQVGGRGKLIDLCQRIATEISKSVSDQSVGTKQQRMQSQYESIRESFQDLDRTIAELIEMERSIFQGGEHLATISFAQCMSIAWGRIARDAADSAGSETVFEFTKSEGVFENDGVLGMFDENGQQRQQIESFDLMTAKIRQQLHIGMKEIRIKAIRNGLAKSWDLGFFSHDELNSFLPPPPTKAAYA